MEWLSFIVLICASNPVEGVSKEGCQTYYKVCIERLAAEPQAQKLEHAEARLALELYNNPSSRKACSKVIQ